MTFRTKTEPAAHSATPGGTAGASPESTAGLSIQEQAAFEKVRAATIEVLPRLAPDRVRPGASVMEAGIDSLKVIELTLALEEHFAEVSLPEWLGSVDDPKELTFGSLARYLCRTSSQR